MNGRPINDPELDALLGAYALDAVDDDERVRVEAYLEVNPNARHEVDDLRESAASLALAPHDDTTAPVELWDRISSSIAVESRVVTPLRRRSRPAITAVLGIAAAVAIIALATSTIVLSGRSSSRANLASVFDKATKNKNARQIALRAPGSGAELARVVLLPDGTGFLKNESMKRLSSDETYQLWALTGDSTKPTAISAGVLGGDPSVIGFHAPVSTHGLGVTVERAPGVVQTAQPMYAAATLS